MGKLSLGEVKHLAPGGPWLGTQPGGRPRLPTLVIGLQSLTCDAGGYPVGSRRLLGLLLRMTTSWVPSLCQVRLKRHFSCIFSCNPYSHSEVDTVLITLRIRKLGLGEAEWLTQSCITNMWRSQDSSPEDPGKLDSWRLCLYWDGGAREWEYG